MQKADVFVFLDDVQFDKHGWRNRNRIKTAQGTQWLTIPVNSSGTAAGTTINEVQVCSSNRWHRKHSRTIMQSYSRAPFFSKYWDVLIPLIEKPADLLVDITIPLTIQLAELLGIEDRRFIRSSDLGCTGAKTERLIEILNSVGATRYISGPSAREYLDETAFARAGIVIEYMTYNYSAYPQLHPPFDSHVSILDLLFMTGPDAPFYIWDAQCVTRHDA
jgi:hypothetical protein